MKYMLLIYSNEKSRPDSDSYRDYEVTARLAQRLKSEGKFLAGDALQPVTTSTSVRVRDGKQTVTDGPFAETHEQLGGYFLIEAGNLDEAITIAGQIPAAREGTVEIRPIFEP